MIKKLQFDVKISTIRLLHMYERRLESQRGNPGNIVLRGYSSSKVPLTIYSSIINDC